MSDSDHEDHAPEDVSMTDSDHEDQAPGDVSMTDSDHEDQAPGDVQMTDSDHEDQASAGMSYRDEGLPMEVNLMEVKSMEAHRIDFVPSSGERYDESESDEASGSEDLQAGDESELDEASGSENSQAGDESESGRDDLQDESESDEASGREDSQAGDESESDEAPGSEDLQAATQPYRDEPESGGVSSESAGAEQCGEKGCHKWLVDKNMYCTKNAKGKKYCNQWHSCEEPDCDKERISAKIKLCNDHRCHGTNKDGERCKKKAESCHVVRHMTANRNYNGGASSSRRQGQRQQQLR
jgi:hypothetical protein